jgi:hypothetical protein
MSTIDHNTSAKATIFPEVKMNGSAPLFQFKHEVLFRALVSNRRSMAFPCDPQGGVSIDSLSEREKNDYLFARAMMGRDFAAPSVRSRDLNLVRRGSALVDSPI